VVPRLSLYSGNNLNHKRYVRAIDLESFVGFNGDMIRCLSCDGILTKDEAVCYRCGDPAPEHAKSGSSFGLLLAVGLILSIGFTAYTFLLAATP